MNKTFLFIRSVLKKILEVILGKDKYRDLRVNYIIKRFKSGNFYKKDIKFLSLFVKSGDVAVDIGANVGEHIFVLSKLVGPEGRVIGFEPEGEAFNILTKIIKKLSLENVEVYNIALGEEETIKTIKTPTDQIGIPNLALSYITNKISAESRHENLVKMRTLDNLRRELPILNKVKLINCDVEGYELMVFKGGKNLISYVRPVIFCEIEKNFTVRYNYYPQDIFDFFYTLKYKAYAIKNELELVDKYDGLIDYYVFVPEKNENSSSK